MRRPKKRRLGIDSHGDWFYIVIEGKGRGQVYVGSESRLILYRVVDVAVGRDSTYIEVDSPWMREVYVVPHDTSKGIRRGQTTFTVMDVTRYELRPYCLSSVTGVGMYVEPKVAE